MSSHEEPAPLRHQLETLAVHAGQPRPGGGEPLVLPVTASTLHKSDLEQSYADIPYPRLSNLPNQRAVAAKIAALEGAEAGLVTASGMAAISTTLLALMEGGGHLLVVGGLYGGTHTLVTHELAAWGVRHAFLDLDDPVGWAGQVQPDTRVIYCEAIVNPTMRVPDHRAIVEFARAHDLLAVIDNTFATPVLFRPLALGYDLSLHSATKYLNGHSDLVAGAITGRREHLDRILTRLSHFGGTLAPQLCALLNRGLGTLALRVRAQSDSAAHLARWLVAQPHVERVHYPGLASHPDHAHARALLDGFGGMLALELAGDAAMTRRFLDTLELFTCSVSLGGIESVVTAPALTSHRPLSASERRAAGISDGLVRVSVGIEAASDLQVDLASALRACG